MFLETSANGMIATLGYLAIHQDEQEKARAEVMSQLDSNGQLVRPCLWFLSHA